jgi:hypothetical protein
MLTSAAKQEEGEGQGREASTGTNGKVIKSLIVPFDGAGRSREGSAHITLV